MADYVGRKRMMLWSVFLYAAFTGLTALATGFWTMLALRFRTGVAMGSEWSTGVAMVAETWPERARPKGAVFCNPASAGAPFWPRWSGWCSAAGCRWAATPGG